MWLLSYSRRLPAGANRDLGQHLVRQILPAWPSPHSQPHHQLPVPLHLQSLHHVVRLFTSRVYILSMSSMAEARLALAKASLHAVPFAGIKLCISGSCASRSTCLACGEDLVFGLQVWGRHTLQTVSSDLQGRPAHLRLRSKNFRWRRTQLTPGVGQLFLLQLPHRPIRQGQLPLLPERGEL